MSVFSSLCHLKHGDKLDVAYSILGDETRIIIWEDEDGGEGVAYLNKKELEHLIELLNYANGKMTE